MTRPSSLRSCAVAALWAALPFLLAAVIVANALRAALSAPDGAP